MSLKIWLPLNGNYQNKGLSFVKYKDNYSPTYVEGKIGKCLNGTVSISMDAPEAIKSTSYTIAMWIKSNPTNTTSSVWWKIAQLTYADGTSNSVYTASEGRYKIEYNPEYNVYCNSQEWNHIAYVVEATKISGYVNGKLYGSTSCTNPERLLSTFTVGGNANTFINDVRLYDHCLSLKEIEEISKGLCLHYTLNNKGYGQENLVAGSATFDGWTISNGWVKSIDTDGSTYIKFNRTGATANNWVRAIPQLKLNPNDYPEGITVSFDFKVTDLNVLNHKCIISLQIYNADGTRIGWNEPNNTSFTNYDKITNGEWVRIARHFTQNDLFRIGQTGYTTADVSYTMLSFQLVQNGEIFIKKVKAEAGNVMTSWSPHSTDSFYSLTEFDASGFNNNGIKTGGILTSVIDTSRFSTCYEFTRINSANAQSNCAMIVNDNFYFPSEFTISYWAYDYGVTGLHPNNFCSYFGYGTSAGHSSDGIHNYDARIVLNTCSFGDTTKIRTLSTTMTYPKNTWIHVAITFDGINLKLYNDGVLKGTSSTGLTTKEDILRSSGALYIGADQAGGLWRGVSGRMSDFRIYATPFSEIDIKKLYNTPAAIDNDGNLYSLEFNMDETSNFKIKKTGVIHSKDFEEVPDLKQTQIKENTVIAKQFYEY